MKKIPSQHTKIEPPEHHPEATGQTLCFLFEQVWLCIADEPRLPQKVALLTSRVETSCKSATRSHFSPTLFSDVSKPTYVPEEDSQGVCKDDGGRGSRTSPSPPSCHPPCRPCSPLTSASPTPGLVTGSLHLPWSIKSNT